MKGKIRSIFALLAILMLVATLVPLASTNSAVVASSLDTREVIPASDSALVALCSCNINDIAVAPDGNTIYVISDNCNALYKSTDGGSTFATCTMPFTFVPPPRAVAVAPDNPNVVAVSDSAANEAVFISTNGGVTWAALPALNGAAASMRIMDVKVGPARIGTILGRDYLVATADETAGVALGSLQIIGETVAWVNVAAPGTADFTSCEFSPNFIGDRVVLGVGSTTAATNLYTYSVPNYSTVAAVLVHAAVQLNGVTVDFGAAANGILVSDIAVPSDYDPTTPTHERAYASFAAVAAAPNNGGVYRCDGIIAPVELGLASTRITSIAYAGTATEGKLLAGERETTMVWHTTDPVTSAPTWTAATTPPTGTGEVVVGMHPQVLTNQICYAGTSGPPDCGFSISTDNAHTFPPCSPPLSLIVDYQFPAPEIKPVRIPTGEDEKFETFDQIRMTGLHNYGEPGEPVLPCKTARILIPQNHELVSVEVTGEKIKLSGQYLIEPGQVQIPLNSDNFSYTPPNPKIYQSKNPFPASPYQVIGVQGFRGYKILLVKLIPIEYIPAARELSYFASMRVTVKTALIEEHKPLYRGTAVDEERVKAMVDNPALLEKYPLNEELTSETLSLPSGEYDMVIITNNALKPYWDAYASWKTLNRGIKTMVYTVEDIYSEYAGDDNQDKIRNFIIDAFNVWEIEYVLLGGDVDIVPVRPLRSYGLAPEDIPSDLNYAGLDGDWDLNGNGIYGESGEEDWLAEVYVGRIPVDNTTHIANFYNKAKDYEEEILTGYRCKVLFLAGSGWSYKKEDTEAQEFPPSGLTITKIYIPPYTPPCDTDVINAINAGTHIINHFGHGGTDYWVDFLNSSEVGSLTNTDYCFCYTVGCWTNAFDQDDAISEHFLCTEHGAFAYIGNTRYGWSGSSHEFELEFYDALFDEHMVRLGPILQDSKEEFAGSYQYTYYALNLLGDPSTLLRIGCDLLVRDHPLDNGSLPSDSAFWTSPDICVDAPPYGSGCPGASENPEYGSVNHVYVTVKNIGCLPAESVSVKLYWADPSGGIYWPDDWHYIDSQLITSIPAGGEVATPYPINWTPTGTAIGHRCLLATVEAACDPISTHNVQWDNNVAQLNVTIVDLLLLRPRLYKTEFVLNPLTLQGERDLKITLLQAPIGVMAKLQIPHTVEMGEVEGDSSTRAPLSRWTLSCIPSCLPKWQVAVTSVSDGADTTAVVPNFVCNKKEVVNLEIKVPRGAGTGGEFTLRITEELDGEIIGGVDYIVRY